jgi:hypothetical protein
MDAPFIFVTTHRIDPRRRDEFHGLSRQLTEFVETNEPEMLAYYAYLSDDGDEISLVQVHRDATSADRHLQMVHTLIEPAFEMSEVARIDVYGRPGDLVQQAIAANAERGVPVNVKPASVDGFARV